MAAKKKAAANKGSAKKRAGAKNSKNGIPANGGGSQFEQTFKNIDDVLREEAGCSSELDYTEQTSWLLFLKYLDDLEQEKAMEAELRGKSYEHIIDEPHRWSSWAAPPIELYSLSAGSKAQLDFPITYRLLRTYWMPALRFAGIAPSFRLSFERCSFSALLCARKRENREVG